MQRLTHTRSPLCLQEPFTLHDGPPYANGDLHIGHALNKVRVTRCHPRVLGTPPLHRLAATRWAAAARQQ